MMPEPEDDYRVRRLFWQTYFGFCAILLCAVIGSVWEWAYTVF